MRPIGGPVSSREWEVLDLMATGASPREIATELVVPLETVQKPPEAHFAQARNPRAGGGRSLSPRSSPHRRPG